MGIHLGRAFQLVDLRRYDEVVDECTLELAESPDSPVAFALRGLALINLNKLRKAESDISKALSLNPEYSFAYYLTSYVWEQKRSPRKAINAIREALRLDYSPDNLHRLGELSSRYSQNKECLEATERALEIDPRHQDSILLRASTLENMGRSEEAQSLLQMSMSINPENPNALQALGAATLREGRATDAIELLHEARRISPVEHHDRGNLATAYGRQMWPFDRIDAIRRLLSEMAPVKAWSIAALSSTLLILVLLVTKSDFNRHSLPSMISFAVFMNTAGLLLVNDNYAGSVGRILSRRDLDMRWYQILQASFEPALVIIIYHLVATILGALLSIYPGLTFFVLSLLMGSFLITGIYRSTGIFGWILVPAAIAGIFMLALFGSLWIPKLPVTVLSYWAAILAITCCGSLLSGYSINAQSRQI